MRTYPDPTKCELNLSPRHGGTCPNCGRTVWGFDGVTVDVEAQLVAQIRGGDTVSAIKLLRSVSGRGLADAKWMIEHMYGTAGIPCRRHLETGGYDI
jgi:hypothetical protein